MKNEAHLLLKQHLDELGVFYWTEHKFCDRDWRFDFAFTVEKIDYAIEIDGGQFSGGHRRGFISKKVRERADRKGMTPQTPAEEDFDKQNTGTMQGFRILHFSPQQVLDGRAKKFLEEHLAQQTAPKR